MCTGNQRLVFNQHSVFIHHSRKGSSPSHRACKAGRLRDSWASGAPTTKAAHTTHDTNLPAEGQLSYGRPTHASVQDGTHTQQIIRTGFQGSGDFGS